MATPQEVYNSDVYRKIAESVSGIVVPQAWFQDVYEALGKVLAAQHPLQRTRLPHPSNCGCDKCVFGMSAPTVFPASR